MRIVYKESERDVLVNRLDALIESRDTSKQVAYIELTEEEFDVAIKGEALLTGWISPTYKGYTLVEED